MLDLLAADLRHMLAAWNAPRWRLLLHGWLRSWVSPGVEAVAIFRLAQVFYRHRVTRWFAQLLKARAIRRCGVELHPGAAIGPGFAIVHGLGIVVGHEVIAGTDLVLYQGVTLGHTGRPGGGQPKIGDRVRIGAGAKVLGSVLIGDDVKIGANAVVLADVPTGATVVGVWRG